MAEKQRRSTVLYLGNQHIPLTIVIDLEYPGKDEIIKTLLEALLAAHGRPEHIIRFARIGSHPRVHYAAKDVLDKKKKPNEVVVFEDLLRPLKKADGRLRACFSMLVDAQARTFTSHYTRRKRSVKRSKK